MVCLTETQTDLQPSLVTESVTETDDKLLVCEATSEARTLL